MSEWNWIKVSDKEPANNKAKYWVLFESDDVEICRFLDYKSIGCGNNKWQNILEDEFDMPGTSYIEIIKPEPPIRS